MKKSVAVFALGCSVWFVELFGLKWVPPYCSHQEDGAGYNAFGFPLAYRQFGGVSSLEYNVLLPAHIFNIAVISLVFFLVLSVVLSVVLKMTNISDEKYIGIPLTIIGFFLILMFLIQSFIMYQNGYLMIADSLSEYFWLFKPVGIAQSGDNACS